jgi:hypothetical protein
VWCPCRAEFKVELVLNQLPRVHLTGAGAFSLNIGVLQWALARALSPGPLPAGAFHFFGHGSSTRVAAWLLA